MRPVSWRRQRASSGSRVRHGPHVALVKTSTLRGASAKRSEADSVPPAASVTSKLGSGWPGRSCTRCGEGPPRCLADDARSTASCSRRTRARGRAGWSTLALRVSPLLVWATRRLRDRARRSERRPRRPQARSCARSFLRRPPPSGSGRSSGNPAGHRAAAPKLIPPMKASSSRTASPAPMRTVGSSSTITAAASSAIGSATAPVGTSRWGTLKPSSAAREPRISG